MYFFSQSFADTTPKKTREESMRTHKESLLQQQSDAESGLLQRHKEFLELELRKFKRRKVLQKHQLQQQQLKEVSYITCIRLLVSRLNSMDWE